MPDRWRLAPFTLFSDSSNTNIVISTYTVLSKDNQDENTNIKQKAEVNKDNQSLTFMSTSFSSCSKWRTTTWPAVPPTNSISVAQHRAIFCTPSWGSSLNGSYVPTCNYNARLQMQMHVTLPVMSVSSGSSTHLMSRIHMKLPQNLVKVSGSPDLLSR